MSISGITTTSSAAYLQQLQQSKQPGVPSQTADAQTTAPQGTTPSQQPGQVHHHHHHHGGGEATGSSDLTQSGTTATGGMGILNTLA